MEKIVHGSFAFEFREAYTLITVSGAWNLECVRIHNAIMKKRAKKIAGQRRVSLIDARSWGFETPECAAEFRQGYRHIADNQVQLYIAYWLSEKNFTLASHLLGLRNQAYDGVVFWHACTGLDQAKSWLRSQRVAVPCVKETDFPVPVPATDYLSYLD